MMDKAELKRKFIRWMEDNRGLILTVIGLPASFMFDIILQVLHRHNFKLLRT